MVSIAATVGLLPSLAAGTPFGKRDCPTEWPSGTIRLGDKYLDRGLASNNGTFLLTTHDQAGVFGVEPCPSRGLQQMKCIVRRL